MQATCSNLTGAAIVENGCTCGTNTCSGTNQTCDGTNCAAAPTCGTTVASAPCQCGTGNSTVYCVSGQTCTDPTGTPTCNSDVTSDTFTFQAVGKSGKAIFYETAKGADSGFTISWAKLAEVTSTTTNQTVQQQQGALASQDFMYSQTGNRITLSANIAVGNGNSAPTV